MTDTDAIRWPDRYAPALAPIHVVNDLAMAAPPEAVWAVLIRAADWPGFYANASKVVVEGGGPDLGAGARFSWKTFGVDLKTQVLEFEPPHRIAWLAMGTGVEAYHAWLIQPAPGGSHVVTEETQYGVAARAGRLLFPDRMERWHQRWLEGLAEAAER
ncbi:SRPBCC domain-containing protein [Phenylobacterium sp.]|uniref:SRPBCC domain-containing protein n=1 Tax=Phenylobacterium sp. TaxID=1871053 RepID=UPI001202CDC1|nr:SRPBCC domain-containing protein [Phenylobacterium sp.]THD59409.1 MAG: SRPBCC domain-containing protein [Phenylobacterium sp.]